MHTFINFEKNIFSKNLFEKIASTVSILRKVRLLFHSLACYFPADVLEYSNKFQKFQSLKNQQNRKS